MCFLYSDKVVAPMTRISPRAKAGFKNICRVQRSGGSARTHYSVKLIYKQNNVWVVADFINDLL